MDAALREASLFIGAFDLREGPVLLRMVGFDGRILLPATVKVHELVNTGRNDLLIYVT